MKLPVPGYDYDALFAGVIEEMKSHHGLTHFQALNYTWTIASRGVSAREGNYEKMEH